MQRDCSTTTNEDADEDGVVYEANDSDDDDQIDWANACEHPILTANQIAPHMYI